MNQLHSNKNTKTSQFKCFVGGLHPSTTLKSIGQLFSKFGKIEKINLPYDEQKERIKGYAIISFDSKDSAKAAIRTNKLNHHGIDISIRPFLNSKKASKITKSLQEKKLFITGLPERSTREEIFDFFSEFGEIEKLTAQYCFTGHREKFKGFIYLTMKSTESYLRILEQERITFHNRILIARKALSKDELRKKAQKGASSKLRSICHTKDEKSKSTGELETNYNWNMSCILNKNSIDKNKLVSEAEKVCYSDDETRFDIMLIDHTLIKSSLAENRTCRVVMKKPANLYKGHTLALKRSYFKHD